MQRHPWNPSRPIVTWHRGSARAKIKQRERESSLVKIHWPRPLIASSLSLSPSAKLLRGEARLHRTRITMIYVAIQGRRDVPSIQRETSSLSWSRGYHKLSPPVHPLFEAWRRAQKRSRARFRVRIHYPQLYVAASRGAIAGEKETRFHARNCLVTRSRFVTAPIR